MSRITQEELAEMFPDGVPLHVMKVLFPERSQPLTPSEARQVLNALRSKTVAGVEVKPMGDWRRGYCDERVQIQQQSFGGLYQVRVLDGVVWLDWPNRTAEEFATVELAKAAAETDYRQRILSTLSLPAKEPVATFDVVEMGKDGMRGVTHLMPELWWSKYPAGTHALYASPQPEAVITEEGIARAAEVLRKYGMDQGSQTAARLAVNAALQES